MLVGSFKTWTEGLAMGRIKAEKLLLYYKASMIRTRSEGHNSQAGMFFFFLTKWV